MPAQGVMSAASDAGSDTVLDIVLAIWREVLTGAGELGADSHFFLCGGDSLDLMRVLVRVRERLGVALDLRDVGTFSTPRRMAQCCVHAGVARAGSSVLRALETKAATPHVAAGKGLASHHVPSASITGAGSFPCSVGQHALWLAEQLGGVCGLYNTAIAIHFAGTLRVPLLARALSLLLRRHEVLRCSLRHESHTRQLVAHVHTPCDVQLKVELILPATASQRLVDAAAVPFDLAHGPLWRVRLLRIGTQRWILLLCVHHAVTDGWSGSVLLRNLAEGYRALMHDPVWEPQHIDTAFRHWCLQQLPDFEADTNWWRRYLAGADRLPSWPPTGTARWPFTLALGQCVLPDALQADMQRVSREQGLRPAALFLAALRLAILQLSGIAELCIGIPANVRDDSAQDTAVGYFVNLLVLRESLDPASASTGTVRKVQHALDDALRRRAIPFAELARTLKPVPLPSGNPWCDILFAFQNLPLVQPDFGDVDARIEALTLPRGQHPLKVEVLNSAEGYVCRIEYARECLAPADARALLDAVQCQLTALLAGAERSN